VPIARHHTAKSFRLSSDLPIVVEIGDTEENIGPFLPVIDDWWKIVIFMF